MNEFFKKLFTKAASLWANWSMQQRVIIGVIALVVIVGVVTLFRVSATPIMSSVFSSPITDDALLERILTRIDQENVAVTVGPTGLVQVADAATAKRMRVILVSEGLTPTRIDPWEVFDKERWTLTDFERNVNKQRAQEKMIVEHLKAIDDIDNVVLHVGWPPDRLFRSEQHPVTASVTIVPKPGSLITVFPQNRKQIEGIQKLLQFAIVGLQPENITINDNTGLRLNDFDGMAAADRLDLINREQKQIKQQEEHYRKKILTSLQNTFTEDRVRDLDIKIDMDMSKKSIQTKESFGVTLKPRTPGLPYDDSIILESLTLAHSTSETKWEGSGYMPEGPAGVEPDMPPAYKDMSNLFGRMSQNTKTENKEINQHNIQEEKSPQIDRVTVSVNIDGTWKMKRNAKGTPVVLPDGTIEREYTPVTAEILRDCDVLIRDAIGYNSARGDSVTVRNIPFDRSREFAEEDAAYFRKKQLQTTVLVFIVGLTLLLFGFMMFRMISREMERRKRLAEEERARREQMLRESAMAEAEQEGMEVSISLEERTRMELMESAINLAKEHPEDAAQLIRTWLLEE